MLLAKKKEKKKKHKKQARLQWNKKQDFWKLLSRSWSRFRLPVVEEIITNYSFEPQENKTEGPTEPVGLPLKELNNIQGTK